MAWGQNPLIEERFTVDPAGIRHRLHQVICLNRRVLMAREVEIDAFPECLVSKELAQRVDDNAALWIAVRVKHRIRVSVAPR